MILSFELLEAIMVLTVTTALMYVFGRISEGDYGAGFNYTIYPWISTAPETITSLLLLLSGYPTASLYNSIFSATFDLGMALGLVPLIHREARLGYRDLVLFTALSGLFFAFLVYDGVYDVTDSFLSYAFLLFAILYSIRYGFRVKKKDIPRLVGALAGLTIDTIVFFTGVLIVTKYFGEVIGGIVSAILTSVPDMVIAVVYGVNTPEASSEILGCVLHDFVENLATGIIATRRILVVTDVPATIALICVTILPMFITLGFDRVDRKLGLLYLASFIVGLLIPFIV